MDSLVQQKLPVQICLLKLHIKVSVLGNGIKVRRLERPREEGRHRRFQLLPMLATDLRWELGKRKANGKGVVGTLGQEGTLETAGDMGREHKAKPKGGSRPLVPVLGMVLKVFDLQSRVILLT